VRPGQRERARRVIEARSRPPRDHSMAGGAVERIPGRRVVRIGRAHVVGVVATVARPCRCRIGRRGMTLRARDRSMRSLFRIDGRRGMTRERRPGPPRDERMTVQTVGRESGARMVRVFGAGIVGMVATVAASLHGRVGLARQMAIGADVVRVHPAQRDRHGRMVAGSQRHDAAPGDLAMALLASGRETAGDVARRGGVIRPVARDAFSLRPHELHRALGACFVARRAIQTHVPALQRKARHAVRVDHHLTVEKAARRVAAGAGGAELAAVPVFVARDAGCLDALKIQGLVAGAAGRGAVRARQRKPEPRVVESTRDPHRRPAGRDVAGGARHLQIAVRRSRGLLRVQ